MSPSPDLSSNAPAGLTPDSPASGLERAHQTVLVVDLVESVRLLQQHEFDVIERWIRFVNEVTHEVLRARGGRLVKSLGDGMLLTFEDPLEAVASAFDMHRRVARLNRGRAADARMVLRAGLHLCDFVVDAHDIYGPGVNLAARLAGLAGPGQTVASHDVASLLLEGLDVDIEDLGACYLKHMPVPVQAYRLQPSATTASPRDALFRADDRKPVARSTAFAAAPDRRHQAQAGPAPFDLRPMVSLLPLATSGMDKRARWVANLLIDSVIARLSGSDRVRVTSRLSTQRLQGRVVDLGDVGRALGAHFVMSGSLELSGERFCMVAEVADTSTGEVLSADRVVAPVSDLLGDNDASSARAAQWVLGAIVDHQLAEVQLRPIPSLDGFALHLGAMGLMHHPQRESFERSHELLEQLAERYPRVPTPRAWLAKWHVLRSTCGFAAADDLRSERALDHARRAVDLGTDNGFAHAMEAFVRCHLGKDLDGASNAVSRALEVSPSEPMAWAVRSVLCAFQGQGSEAWEAAQRAQRLSPLDPLRHYIDGLAASAAITAGALEQGIELARQSLAQRRQHLPTMRALTIGLVLAGRLDDARASARRMLDADPGFRLDRYRQGAPAGCEAVRARWADALREAGVV
jgi:adenylate cyclase